MFPKQSKLSQQFGFSQSIQTDLKKVVKEDQDKSKISSMSQRYSYSLRNKEKQEEQQIINPLQFCINPTPGKEPKIGTDYQISELPQYEGEEQYEPEQTNNNILYNPELIQTQRLNEYLKFARILVNSQQEDRAHQNEEVFLRNLHLHHYNQRKALKYIAQYAKEDRVRNFLGLFEDKSGKQ